ncbi:sin3 histone deacetylase corepressor complex component SDS3 isoform X2 [Nilaparvata lugens]|uniref:sin3 histone deacetylase corepressor complex component SDS3 isoform X2 n=1 Tax=Nilaparvata lugens TaxID=108931 RepID=UPI00193C95F4|nr:sin3 histone deacetylase corepressor complex component SDS3 isoform X2 [Nilaparvata lugens]
MGLGKSVRKRLKLKYTEEASESELRKPEEYTEIKEQVYQDNLASLKKQLQQLKDGSHPEYNKKLKKLESLYKERLRINTTWREFLVEVVEKEYVYEQKAAAKELEEKKVELRASLVIDMEEKRKTIEMERITMELSGDTTETKPAITRKLRRRPHDPAPTLPDKRRGGGKMASLPAHLNYLLDEKEIELDLKIMSRVKTIPPNRKPTSSATANESCSKRMAREKGSDSKLDGRHARDDKVNLPAQIPSVGSVLSDCNLPDTRIEDGKLLYERRWFHRGQPVYVEGKDMNRFAAIISAIGTESIWVKKTSDASKVKIYLSQLSRGRVSIKRRAAS